MNWIFYFKNTICKKDLSLISCFAFLLLACANPTEKETSRQEINNIEALTDDGVWCWFSDPRAIYHRGEKEKIYFGSINTKGGCPNQLERSEVW